MWKTIRITVLLLVLVIAAGRTWLDRVTTQSWKSPLWVGIYPLNADGSPSAQSYIADLSATDFANIASFFEREAHRFAVALDEPVHIELYPQGKELPPQLNLNSGATSSCILSGQPTNTSSTPVSLFTRPASPSPTASRSIRNGARRSWLGVAPYPRRTSTCHRA